MNFRRLELTLAMVAAALGAACESTTDVQDLTNVPADAVESVLATGTLSLASDDGRGSGIPLFDQLADQIPGFGGLYRDGRCTVVVVLTDLSQAQHAERVLLPILERLMGRPCAGHIRIQPKEGQFTYTQLKNFLSHAEPLRRVRGVAGVAISFQDNRLVVSILARTVAATVIEALPTLDIPPSAVIFQVVAGNSGGGTRGG